MTIWTILVKTKIGRRQFEGTAGTEQQHKDPESELGERNPYDKAPPPTLFSFGLLYFGIQKQNWGLVSDAVPFSEAFSNFGSTLGNDLVKALIDLDPPQWENAVVDCRNFKLGWDKELYCLRQLGIAGGGRIVYRSSERLLDKLWAHIFPLIPKEK